MRIFLTEERSQTLLPYGLRMRSKIWNQHCAWHLAGYTPNNVWRISVEEKQLCYVLSFLPGRPRLLIHMHCKINSFISWLLTSAYDSSGHTPISNDTSFQLCIKALIDIYSVGHREAILWAAWAANNSDGLSVTVSPSGECSFVGETAVSWQKSGLRMSYCCDECSELEEHELMYYM